MKAGSAFISRIAKIFLGASLAFAMGPAGVVHGQSNPPPAGVDAETGTSTDLYIMMGSDFDRPGLLPRANYNIGIGHTFGFLKKDPIGDELTFAYTYEDAGGGFWHSQFGSHTESFGVMKNFGLPKTKRVTGYTWIQGGISTYTGNATLQNHFFIMANPSEQSCISIITIQSGFRKHSTKSPPFPGIRPPVSATPGVGRLPWTALEYAPPAPSSGREGNDSLDTL